MYLYVTIWVTGLVNLFLTYLSHKIQVIQRCIIVSVNVALYYYTLPYTDI